MRTIWAPYKLDELKGRRGLFQVEAKLAEKLLKEGLVQDPAIGAAKLTKITDESPTRKAPKKKEVKAKKVVEPEERKVTAPVQDKMIADDDLDVVTD